MSDDGEGPRRRRRGGCCAPCGVGCVVVLVLAAGISAILHSATGAYQPHVSPIPPAPPVNGFADIVAAGQMLKATGGTGSVYAGAQTSPSLSAEAALVRRSQPALARLRRGLAKPVQVPVARSFSATFPYLADTRELARLLSAEADVRAARGDYTGAFDSGLDTMQLGMDVERGGGLIHGLVAIADEAIARNGLVDRVDLLPAPVCDRLAGRLQGLLLQRVTTAEVFRNDRDATLVATAHLDPREAVQTLNNGAGTSSQGARMAGSMVWHFMRDRTLKDLERYYDALDREAAKPAAQRRPVPQPTSPLAAMLVGVYDQAIEKFDETDAEDRLLLIALRVRSYRLKHDRLPGSLDALGIPASLLTDPYSGKALVYRPAGGDYLLYSIGPDLKDDGGVPADLSAGPVPPGDLGLRRFQSRQGFSPASHYYRLVPHMKRPKLPPGAPPLGK